MKPRKPGERYEPALIKAREELKAADPFLTASLSGVGYQQTTADAGQFEVSFWGQTYLVEFPEGSVREADSSQEPSIPTQILLLHYLDSADGTRPADKWISFRELPGGLGYNEAFEGRANQRIARAFGRDVAGFVRAAEALGGERLTFGDASFLFRVWPRQWMAVVLYAADEEFSASANVMFDGAASHYLPTEDWAVLAGMLASRLIKTAQGELTS